MIDIPLSVFFFLYVSLNQIKLNLLAQYQKNFVNVLKQAQRCLQAWVPKIESAMNACRREAETQTNQRPCRLFKFSLARPPSRIQSIEPNVCFGHHEDQKTQFFRF